MNYQELAMRTAKNMKCHKKELIHAALGIAGEAGEFVDAVKKHVIYDKPLDKENCIEELGDALWYVALACNALGVTIEEVQRRNIAKLKLRYPEKYTDEAAINRADKL
jgi:NTP pyrophosphatase (non-canonical NTP hydrolase)